MFRSLLPLLFFLACSSPLVADPPPRLPWSASKVTGHPEPPSHCIVERVRPDVTFKLPIEVIRHPDGRRLLVAEHQSTLIHALDPNSKEPPQIVANLKEFHREAHECFSIAVHPKFATNRFVYVWFNLQGWPHPNRADGTHIVRFTMTQGDSPRLDLKTGKTILTFISGGHNGGSLRFGPDGMLYICIGDSDSPDPPDSRNTGQDISDLSSSILRIDVDHEDVGRAYRIPVDNPFIKMSGARGEVWAYGLRNPWRMSFDPITGELYVGDVGWELWEGIFRGRRGGNYGWAITEMSKQPVKPDAKRGPTPILPPLVVHSHEESASITGGETYTGKRMPELRGMHIYGDFETGRIWAFRAKGDQVIEQRELCDTSAKIIGFAADHDGEVLFADYGRGGLYRLAANPERGKPSDFPRRLSETGLFADVKNHQPQQGVAEYGIRAERWADHATSQRLLALPGGAVIQVAAREGVAGGGKWSFPRDSVLTKTYSLELERGNPKSARRIETQMLHFNGEAWNTYTYRWNDAQTDAHLVPASGDTATFQITDPEAKANGDIQRRTLTWRFFSRAECQRCHNNWTDYTPGFNASQLDRGSAEAPNSALDAWFSHPPVRADSPVVNPHDGKASLESRARSYLHVNCGTCHRFGGGGSVASFFNIEAAIKDARFIDAHPTQGTLEMLEARVVAPGDPYRSTLLFRMATSGRGHMPYLGGRSIDDRALVLMRDWIAGMNPASQMSEQTREQRKAEALSLKRLQANEADACDELLRTSSGALSAALALADGSLSREMRAHVMVRGSAVADPLKRDLFERFLPDEKRRVVLGDRIDPVVLLAQKGDASRGRLIFTQQGGAQCATCHRVSDEGTSFGPDLTKIGAKYKREELLQQIITPSKQLDPAWKLAILEMNDGSVHSGFVTARTARDITLRLPGGKQATFAHSDIESHRTSELSAMPEGLLGSLTVQEAADLMAYLESLR